MPSQYLLPALTPFLFNLHAARVQAGHVLCLLAGLLGKGALLRSQLLRTSP